MRRCLYSSSAFAASRRPPHVAESERATGGFTQECVITVAGGRDPSGRPEKQRDRQKEPLAAELSWRWRLNNSRAAGQQHQEPPSVFPADGPSPPRAASPVPAGPEQTPSEFWGGCPQKQPHKAAFPDSEFVVSLSSLSRSRSELTCLKERPVFELLYASYSRAERKHQEWRLETW